MPDTHRKVRIVTGKESGVANVWPDAPVVMVDSKPLYGVTEIRFHHKYGEMARATADITLIGVDINLEAVAKYAVRVIGPEPPKED